MAVLHRRPDGMHETVIHDPRLHWADTRSLAADGYLYVTVNQLNRQSRYQGDVDQGEKPHSRSGFGSATSPFCWRRHTCSPRVR